MNAPLALTHLTKSFGAQTALKDVTLELPAGRVAGLLGRNGAGKTTLLNLACGLLLPTSGRCATLGRSAGELEASELGRLGVVFQEGRFLDWMTVRQQLDFHASFYGTWDRARETRLLSQLELDPDRKIGQLSTGDRQKVGILLGVCHHPELLLLDEPVSSLDPIARLQMLAFLLDLIREDGSTIVISSHILSDVEKIVDWVICLDGGELTTSSPLDELQEGYADWIVTPAHGQPLPASFPESWILAQEGNAQRRRLKVRPPSEAAQARFESAHGVTVEKHYLNLEELFPLLLRQRKVAA